MVWHGQLTCKQAVFILIHVLFQDHINGFVVIETVTQASSASQDQAFIAHPLGKAQDTQAGFLSLLGVAFAVKDVMDIEPYILMYRSGPAQELLL